MNPNILFIFMDNLGYGEVGCYGVNLWRASYEPVVSNVLDDGPFLKGHGDEGGVTAEASRGSPARRPSAPARLPLPPKGDLVVDLGRDHPQLPVESWI